MTPIAATALMVLGALATAPGRPTTGAADLQAQESVRRAIECLRKAADIRRPPSTAFAAAIGDVLRKHHVEPPQAPASASAPAGEELTETERDSLLSAVKDLVATCGRARASDPNLGRALHRLHLDLLTAVTAHCPDSVGRLSAAQSLAAWVLPDAECRRPLDELVPAGVALPAIDAALNYALAKGAGGDERWPGTIADWQVLRLLPQWAAYSAMGAGPLTPEALEKALEKGVERIVSFQTRDGPDSYVEFVDKARRAARTYQARSADVADELNATLAAVRLCADFFAAVQQEDKATAGKLLTPKAAEKWLAGASLRSAVSNAADASAVALVAISPACQAGPATFRVEALLRVTDAAGKTTSRRILLTLTRKDGEFRIGE